MSKKSKPSKQKKSATTSLSSQADRYLDLTGHQIFQGDYAGAVMNCERLLNYLPKSAPQRVDALEQLGTAHGMLQNFPQSYAAYTEALSLAPNNAELWFNRGMASRFTSRFGRSLRDYERAKELNTRPELEKKLEKELKFARELAEKILKLRGPEFTWGNLGISLMMQERYDEAEAALRRALVIDPRYKLAKENLAALPGIRRTGIPPMVDIKEPFKDSKLKQSITFIKE